MGWAQRRRYERMRVGYMRLQALIRSRVLSHRFRHLRGHIVGLQARARGNLVRRMYRQKMWAIIKIQAHVRRIIAQRRFNKIKVSQLAKFQHGYYRVVRIQYRNKIGHCSSLQ